MKRFHKGTKEWVSLDEWGKREARSAHVNAAQEQHLRTINIGVRRNVEFVDHTLFRKGQSAEQDAITDKAGVEHDQVGRPLFSGKRNVDEFAARSQDTESGGYTYEYDETN